MLLAVTSAICLTAWFLQDRWVLVVDVAPVKVLTVVMAIGTAAVIWLAAGSMAQQVKQGSTVDLRFVGVSTYAVRATPAALNVRGVDRCVLYLGSSDGDAVLYDNGVARVPRDSPRLRLDPDSGPC